MIDQRFYELLVHLYRGGAYGHYWTPDGPTQAGTNGDWGQKISRWFPVNDIPEVPASWAGLNTYFAVNPSCIRRLSHQRIHNTDVAAINCLYVEFDDRPDEGQKRVLKEVLLTFDMPPSVIVDSGGGLHCYWLLEQPFALTGPDEHKRAELVQSAWVTTYAQLGVDTAVHDLARLLRVPGSTNLKPEYAPNYPTVTIVHWQPDKVYDLSDFEREAKTILDQWAQDEVKAANAASAPAVSLSDDELIRVLFSTKNGTDYARLWAGDLSVCHDNHSDCDQKLCNALAWLTGKDASVMDRLFRQSGLYRAKWDKQAYRDRTIDSAISTCQSVYTPNGYLDPVAIAAGQAAIGSQPSPQPKTKPKQPDWANIARAYLALYPGTIYSRGAWHRYSDGLWAPVHDLVIAREINELLEKMAPKLVTDSGRRNIEGFVRAAVYLPEERLDSDDRLINVRNGIYSFELGTLLTHDPARYLTTQLPFEYDPTAIAPYWDLYRRTTFIDEQGAPDPELDQFMAEAVGYSLTTDIRYHVAFWCKGEGANGKGVLFHILEQLAGDAAIPFNVDLLNREQYQLADLAGKRLALCTEAKGDTVVEDALIKALVAGDSLRVRQIRREPFTLRPTVKLWWAMNKLPTVTDTSIGFWRRVLLIPFHADFAVKDAPKRIDDLKDRLIPELPGIFNWAMDGLTRLQTNGAFTRVAQMENFKAAYWRDSNTIQTFVDDECDIDPSYAAGSASLYAKYQGWCVANGFKAYNMRNFKGEMERLGYKYRRMTPGYRFIGLQIKV